MSGEKHYFKDDLVGTGFQIRSHLDEEGDLWIAIISDGDIDFDSVLLPKQEAARLAVVLQRYADS